ncbi:mitochondrial ribosomal protein MRP51 [Dipodascopsis uninucleata]
MEFAKVLQKSKLVSVPRPLKSHHAGNLIPKYQVIQSPPASYYRGDFGLKAPLPKRLGTTHIHVKEINTPEGFTNFEHGSRFYKTRQRFAEMKIPVSEMGKRSEEHLMSDGLVAPLNASYEEYQVQKAPTKLKSCVGSRSRQKALVANLKRQRQSFLESLEQTGLDQSDAANEKLSRRVRAEAFKFMHISTTDGAGMDRTTLASAGLGYAAKGRAFNTPTQISYSSVLPGRELGQGASRPMVGIGGIVCAREYGITSRSENRSDYSERFNVRDYEIRSAGVNLEGVINIVVRPATKSRVQAEYHEEYGSLLSSIEQMEPENSSSTSRDIYTELMDRIS